MLEVADQEEGLVLVKTQLLTLRRRYRLPQLFKYRRKGHALETDQDLAIVSEWLSPSSVYSDDAGGIECMEPLDIGTI